MSRHLFTTLPPSLTPSDNETLRPTDTPDDPSRIVPAAELILMTLKKLNIGKEKQKQGYSFIVHNITAYV